MVVVMILPFVAKNTDFFKKFLELLSGYSLKPDILPAVLYNMNTILDKKIADALQISRQCMNVIVFNFWGTVIVDICGISLAFAGYITPLGAALIHVISELTFILNSARPFRK